ncbi:uncharacterized protein V1510DRAFT_413954 [Dipodascopsis tothii]|uniref:uncharacterized protein n=1 Tax=Dipodascopsis tothii TaxID=44089 RepID=UPI0034CDE08C
MVQRVPLRRVRAGRGRARRVVTRGRQRLGRRRRRAVRREALVLVAVVARDRRRDRVRDAVVADQVVLLLALLLVELLVAALARRLGQVLGHRGRDGRDATGNVRRRRPLVVGHGPRQAGGRRLGQRAGRRQRAEARRACRGRDRRRHVRRRRAAARRDAHAELLLLARLDVRVELEHLDHGLGVLGVVVARDGRRVQQLRPRVRQAREAARVRVEPDVDLVREVGRARHAHQRAPAVDLVHPRVELGVVLDRQEERLHARRARDLKAVRLELDPVHVRHRRQRHDRRRRPALGLADVERRVVQHQVPLRPDERPQAVLLDVGPAVLERGPGRGRGWHRREARRERVHLGDGRPHRRRRRRTGVHERVRGGVERRRHGGRGQGRGSRGPARYIRPRGLLSQHAAGRDRGRGFPIGGSAGRRGVRQRTGACAPGCWWLRRYRSLGRGAAHAGSGAAGGRRGGPCGAG